MQTAMPGYFTLRKSSISYVLNADIGRQTDAVISYTSTTACDDANAAANTEYTESMVMLRSPFCVYDVWVTG